MVQDQWQVHRDYQQSILDGIERVKQQRDEILNKAYDDHPWARAGWTAAAEWTAGGWVLPDSAIPGRVAAEVSRRTHRQHDRCPRRRSGCKRPRSNASRCRIPPRFNRWFARTRRSCPSRSCNRASKCCQVRQEAAQPQVIENPFVGSRTMIPGPPHLDHHIIENPFVGRSTLARQNWIISHWSFVLRHCLLSVPAVRVAHLDHRRAGWCSRFAAFSSMALGNMQPSQQMCLMPRLAASREPVAGGFRRCRACRWDRRPGSGGRFCRGCRCRARCRRSGRRGNRSSRDASASVIFV